MDNPPKPNPLLMDHILENMILVSDLNPLDKLNMREVCVTWNRVATKSYSIVLTLGCESEIIKLEQAVTLLQNPQGNMPFIRSVTFSDGFFSNQSENEAEFHSTFSKFLRIIASEIQIINIQVSEACKLGFDEESYNIRGFDRLDTLETIVINDIQYRPTTREGFIFKPRLIEMILKNSSVLRQIYLDWSLSSNDVTHSWPDLGDRIIANIPSSTTDLDMMTLFSNHDCQVFSSVKLPNLTFLSLDLFFSSDVVTGNNISNLFNSKNSQLEELEFQLVIRTEERIPSFKLPIFPNLRTLRMGLSQTQDFDVNYDTSFSTIFPKVTEFDLTGMYPELLSALLPAGSSAPLVTCLTLRLHRLDIDWNLYKFVHGFPGMTKLILKMQNALGQVEFLTLVFIGCQHLEHLELVLKKCDEDQEETPSIDSILTGIPAQTCESIQTNPDWSAIPVSTIKDSPGLSDLKSLKILKIKSKVPVNITDITAQFGILQLPELKDLVIDDFNITKEVITNLKMKFGEGSQEEPVPDQWPYPWSI